MRLYKDLSWMWPIISPPREYKEECGLFSKVIKRYSMRNPKTLLHLDITFVYLIRQNGTLSVETDFHAGDIFALPVWRRHLTEAGFTIREKRLMHSSFPKDFYMTMFICVKPKHYAGKNFK
jgi:hypothetical protein